MPSMTPQEHGAFAIRTDPTPCRPAGGPGRAPPRAAAGERRRDDLRRRPGGLAFDEDHRQADRPGRLDEVRVVDASGELLDGEAAHLGLLLGDRRQGGGDPRGGGDVVAADHADLARDVPAGRAQRAHDPDRGHVVVAGDGRDVRATSVERRDRREAALEQAVPLDDRCRRRIEPGLGAGAAEALDARGRRRERRRALDVRDPAMPEPDEVADRELGAADVVAGDHRDRQPRGLRVDDDDRDRRPEQPLPARLRHLARGDDHAVDAAVDHEVEVVHRPVLVVGGAPEQDGIAEGAGRDVGRLDELREERVLDVGDDEAERPRAPHAQRSRHARRAVVQLVDRGHDRRRRLGLGIADPREHAADGRGRDARPQGDVADRDGTPPVRHRDLLVGAGDRRRGGVPGAAPGEADRIPPLVHADLQRQLRLAGH